MRKITIIILIISTIAIKSKALCPTGDFVSPLSNVCWHCVFPIRFFGVEIPSASGGLNYKGEVPTKSPVCACLTPFPRMGVTFSMWEPRRIIENVIDAGCLRSLGLDMNLFTRPYQNGTYEDDDEEETYSNVHYIIYPVFALMELFLDAACLQGDDLDLAYISEIDPTWHDSEITMLINPEAILFANPIATLACSADSVAATFNHPLDPLFWCAGSANIYPLNGHNVESAEGHVTSKTIITYRALYHMHRIGIINYTLPGNLCNQVPSFVWIKSRWKFQFMVPIKGVGCHPIGKAGILYDSLKNPPLPGQSNMVYLMWKQRLCCLF